MKKQVNLVMMFVFMVTLSFCGGGGGSSSDTLDPNAQISQENVARSVQKTVVSTVIDFGEEDNIRYALVRKLDISDEIDCSGGGTLDLSFSVPDEVYYEDEDGQGIENGSFNNCIETYSNEESCFQIEEIDGDFTCVVKYKGDVITQNCFTGSQGDPCNGDFLTYTLDGVSYQLGLELSSTFDSNDPEALEILGSVCIDGEEISLDELEEDDLVCEEPAPNSGNGSNTEITLGVNASGDKAVISGLPGCNGSKEFSANGATAVLSTIECNNSGIVNQLDFNISYDFNGDIDAYTVDINGVEYTYRR